MCGCVYRHPKTDIDELTNYISKCISKISKEKKESFIAGDFNVDLLKYECSSKHQNFLNMMTSSGFLPHILQPTRISEQSSTVIDNIYGNNLEQEIISGNILIQFADHLSQFSSIKKKIMRTKHSQVYKRNFSVYNEQSYIDDVSIQNWNANNLQGTNTKFNDFVWRLESCVDRHALSKN